MAAKNRYWTVVGYWTDDDFNLPWVDHIRAECGKAAAGLAPDGVVVVAVFEGRLTDRSESADGGN